MRRKSERNKAKTPPTPAVAERPKRGRPSRRRRKSDDEDEPEEEDAPEAPPPKQDKSPSDDEGADQVWHVKTSDGGVGDGGEIRKLKICLSRPAEVSSLRGRRRQEQQPPAPPPPPPVEDKRKSRHRSRRTSAREPEPVDVTPEAESEEAEPPLRDTSPDAPARDPLARTPSPPPTSEGAPASGQAPDSTVDIRSPVRPEPVSPGKSIPETVTVVETMEPMATDVVVVPETDPPSPRTEAVVSSETELPFPITDTSETAEKPPVPQAEEILQTKAETPEEVAPVMETASIQPPSERDSVSVSPTDPPEILSPKKVEETSSLKKVEKMSPKMAEKTLSPNKAEEPSSPKKVEEMSPKKIDKTSPKKVEEKSPEVTEGSPPKKKEETSPKKMESKLSPRVKESSLKSEKITSRWEDAPPSEVQEPARSKAEPVCPIPEPPTTVETCPAEESPKAETVPTTVEEVHPPVPEKASHSKPSKRETEPANKRERISFERKSPERRERYSAERKERVTFHRSDRFSSERPERDQSDRSGRRFSSERSQRHDDNRSPRSRRPEETTAVENGSTDDADKKARKRKWGSRPKLSKTPSVNISTDSLKNIIPEIETPVAEEVPPAATVAAPPLRPEEPKIKRAHMDEPVRKERERPPTVTRKISVVHDDGAKLQNPPSPPKCKTSSVLYITNLVRPFTLPQLKNLLQRTGKLVENGFWIDRIKSKCYVEYETEDEAIETRHALHGVTWPVSNPKTLVVDFGSRADMEAAMATTDEDRSGPGDGRAKDPANRDLRMDDEEKVVEKRQTVREWDLGKGEGREEYLDRHSIRQREAQEPEKKKRRSKSHSPSPARKFKKKEEEAPSKLLDDLFKKTKTTPCIYWLPLDPEVILVKEEQRRKHMAEHERRLEEIRKAEEQRMSRKHHSSSHRHR